MVCNALQEAEGVLKQIMLDNTLGAAGLCIHVFVVGFALPVCMRVCA